MVRVVEVEVEVDRPDWLASSSSLDIFTLVIPSTDLVAGD